MTEQEKQLLLEDLCARLPYGVKVDVNFYSTTKELSCALIQSLFLDEKSLRPYLRPMSSMTEEERMELAKLFNKWHDDELFDYIEEGVDFSIWKHKGISSVIFDWLNEHHLDYRGLIPMGLALEATDGMYNF